MKIKFSNFNFSIAIKYKRIYNNKSRQGQKKK